MTNLTNIPEIVALPVEEHTSIIKTFGQYLDWLEDMTQAAKNIIVTWEEQVEIMEQAKTLRKEIARIRIDAEATRKQQKANIILMGRAIDAIPKIIDAMAIPAEAHLLAQEKFIEYKQKAMLDARELARRQELSLYMINGDTTVYNVREMLDDQFNSIVENEKTIMGQRAQADLARKVEEEGRALELELLRAKVKEQEAQALELRKESKASQLATQEILKAQALEQAQEAARLDVIKAEGDKAQAEEIIRLLNLIEIPLWDSVKYKMIFKGTTIAINNLISNLKI